MSSISIVKTDTKSRLSVKAKTLTILAAIAGTVAIPQVFHALGAILGANTAIGETFLPMHLPIILVGLLAGPCVGVIAGLLGPLASFVLSGMPGFAMLPFIMIELCAYGLFAGLLRNVKMPTITKVIAVQLVGRAARAAAILLAVYALDNESVSIASIWTNITTGVWGIVLQLVLIPLIIYRVENLKNNGQ